MEKDNVLGFIQESQHTFKVMKKALECHIESHVIDPKKQVAMSETSSLKNYLKSYGSEYRKKYQNSHFSSPPGMETKIELVDELFSDEEEKQQYMVDAAAKIRVKAVNY